ncbi:hypothetical protein BDW22DRAFT_829405 [Trametopsis cervina]|nr:hypothetical protein BDW22DRAFT_829405 [Trametopsis cervina]
MRLLLHAFLRAIARPVMHSSWVCLSSSNPAVRTSCTTASDATCCCRGARDTAAFKEHADITPVPDLHHRRPSFVRMISANSIYISTRGDIQHRDEITHTPPVRSRAIPRSTPGYGHSTERSAYPSMFSLARRRRTHATRYGGSSDSDAWCSGAGTRVLSQFGRGSPSGGHTMSFALRYGYDLVLTRSRDWQSMPCAVPFHSTLEDPNTRTGTEEEASNTYAQYPCPPRGAHDRRTCRQTHSWNFTEIPAG